jgi:predicted phosphodiesterase
MEGGLKMKPNERKEFFRGNRGELTAEQMCEALQIGAPALKNYVKQFGPCKGGDAVAEATSKLSKEASKLGLSEEEAILALKSLSRGQQPRAVTRHTPISRKSFRFGYFSDAHIGHEKFNTELFDYMVRFFKQAKPDFILNPGDHLEGMSGRPGHVYELSHVGFDQQFTRCVELYEQLGDVPMYGIDGNHDQWFFKKNDNGVVVGHELAKRLPSYTHLGQDEGDLVVGGVKIKLFHAGDGTAYATSYKIQKLIESFSGGEKPNIVLSGHYHKALYLFSRGVHGFECGTLCGQSSFMRGKKIPAHMGFGLVTVYYNSRGAERLIHEFVPWYERGE